MENRTEVPKKTKNRATKWPSNPTTDYTYPEKKLKNIHVPQCNINSSTIYNSQGIRSV